MLRLTSHAAVTAHPGAPALRSPLFGALLTCPCGLFLVLALAVATSASAEMLEPSVCRSDTSPVARLMSEPMARADVLAKMSRGDRCVAYQHHFLAAVKVREVIVNCRDGNDRNRIVARLDGAIETMNSGIAENCGLE
jgi:hypothetical protein